MALVSLKEIQLLLERELSGARYRHSLAVAKLAKRLALTSGIHPELAERLGLVHDNAKEWSPEKFSRYVQKKKIQIPNLAFIKKVSPNMMHAYVGARVAFERGWILKQHEPAVALHTLGAPKMSVLEKIIFVSDFAAYDRTYKQAKKVRQTAMKNIHQAFLEAMAYKIRSSLRKTKAIHPTSIEVWNSYVFRNQ